MENCVALEMIPLLNYLVLSGIFASGFVLFRTPFEFYVNYLFMLLFIGAYFYRCHKIQVSKFFLIFLAIFSGVSLLNVFWGNIVLFSFVKQFGGFVLNGVVYYLLLKINDGDIEKLFYVYLRLAILVAVIGLFQEVSYLIGFTYGYDFSYFIPKFNGGGVSAGLLRVTSILPEPSHFGGAIAPALFISIHSLIKGDAGFIGRKSALAVLSAAVLSFSLVTYVAIVTAVVLILANYRQFRRMLIPLSVVGVFSYLSYQYVPEIRVRVDDTFATMSGRVVLTESNLSTFAFISNASVAMESFKANPIFGSGIGSHPVSYDKYIPGIVDSADGPAALSKDDAGSLFFRLMSETGLLGISLFLYYIARFYVSRKQDSTLWLISNSMICLFVVNLIRLGNFFYCGFIFFIWGYYFTRKVYDARDKSGGGQPVAI